MKNPADTPDEFDSEGNPSAESSDTAPSSAGDSTFGVLQVIHDLERRLDHTFSIREALQADLDSANAKILALESRNDEILQRIAFLEDRDKVADRLQSELDSLRAEKSVMMKTAERLLSRVSELGDEKAVLEKDFSETKSSLTGLERKAGNLQSEMIRIQDTASVEEITDLLAETKAKLTAASEHVKELEAELDDSSTAKDAIVQDLRGNRKEVRKLRREMEALKTSQEDLENRVVKALTRITDELRVFL